MRLYISSAEAVTLTGLSRQRIHQLGLGKVRRKRKRNSLEWEYHRGDLITHIETAKPGRPSK